jgi:hypothetical protein
MRSSKISMKTLLALLAAATVFLHATTCAGEPPAPADDVVVTLDPGKTYRKVNGMDVTGKDVLDLLLEESWEQNLQSFIEYAMCNDEIISRKINVSDADVDAELQALITRYAKQKGVNPADLKIDKLAKEIGLDGGLAALRRQTKMNLGLLRILQSEGQFKAGAHIWEQGFKEKVGDRLEKWTSEKGVERDPKNLGTGEAVRVGVRSYSRDEVVMFMMELIGQIPLSTLRAKLDGLAFEKLVQAALKEKSVTLNEEDYKFHFSYLCRRREMETGVPGRVAMAQDLQASGLTPDQFLQTRVFKSDAGVTRLVRDPLRDNKAALEKEFNANPNRYKREENLYAHILIRVLDHDGRPYTPLWKAPGHNPVNQFVAKRREEAFAAAKPKVEGLIPEIQANFEAAAIKHSEDLATNRIGGKIGRVGKDTMLVLNSDSNVRDAALKLKPGEISGPVRSDYGWHIIKCLEKQDVTFSEAAERVYVRLLFEGRDKMIGDIMKTAKVEDKF